MSETAQDVRFLPSGDTALVVEFGNKVDRRLSAGVLRLGARITDAGLTGVTETVPTFRSLLVHYDPLATSAQRLVEQIAGLIDRSEAADLPGRLWRIPACHEPDFAPDLAAVAAEVGLSPDQVIERFCAERYHVYMLGFLPGYPYMGDVPEALRLPRRENPRVKVLPGSVGIATNMTAVYCLESPGGWHLIGRTPAPLFDLHADPPALLRPGDAVVFEPISGVEFGRIAQAVEGGGYALAPEEDA